MGHMQQIPVPPHQLNSTVPLAISNAVMRALEKDPALRFQSADEFMRGLKLATAATDQDLPPTVALPIPASPAIKNSAAQSSWASLQSRASSASGSQPLPLEEITRKLAVYIGPVAKFVVKKLAAQTEDLDTIYREAAKQISSETDRAAFLRSKRS